MILPLSTIFLTSPFPVFVPAVWHSSLNLKPLIFLVFSPHSLHFNLLFLPLPFLFQMRLICWSVSGCRASATMIRLRYDVLQLFSINLMNIYPLQLFQNELRVSPLHQTPNQGITGVYLFIVVYLFLLAERMYDKNG